MVHLTPTTRRSVESIFSEEDVMLDSDKEYVPVDIHHHIVDDDYYIAEVAMSMLESENDNLERELFDVLRKLKELGI